MIQLALDTAKQLSGRVLEGFSEREGDDQRSYGAQTTRLPSAAPRPIRLPAFDLECRRPNRIRYNGTGVLGRAEDKEPFAALDCHLTQQSDPFHLHKG